MSLKYMQLGEVFTLYSVRCNGNIVSFRLYYTYAVLAADESVDESVRLSVHSTTDKTNTKHYASWRCSILEVALPASPNRDAPPAVDALRAAMDFSVFYPTQTALSTVALLPRRSPWQATPGR